MASDDALIAWMEAELAGTRFAIQVARTPREAVAALVEDPPPRPQIAAVDFDSLTPADVLQLHAIREGGWFGSLIGIGVVAEDLRKSLAVDRVLAQPLVSDTLRTAVNEVGLDRPTMKMRKITSG